MRAGMTQALRANASIESRNLENIGIQTWETVRHGPCGIK